MAKKKKKAAPKQAPVGAAFAAGIAALRESLKDPETQKRIAANFAKLRPQAQAVMADMKAKQQGTPTDKVAKEYDLEDPNLPSMEGDLRMPDNYVPRAGRLDFYWLCEIAHSSNWDNSSCVKASYILEDSVSTEDVLHHRPGSRKGDWVIDVIGYNGGSLFRQNSNQAKRVAEAILSAIGFENEWRKHYPVDAGYTTEGGEMSIIPGDPPGKTVPPPMAPYQHMPASAAEALTPDPPAGSWSVPTEFVGDNPYDPAAQREHKCCGHCDQARDVHAPHSQGCPSGFDQPRIQTGLPKDDIDEPF